MVDLLFFGGAFLQGILQVFCIPLKRPLTSVAAMFRDPLKCPPTSVAAEIFFAPLGKPPWPGATGTVYLLGDPEPGLGSNGT